MKQPINKLLAAILSLSASSVATSAYAEGVDGYIGGGIGYAFHDTDDFLLKPESDGDFAWQAFAGIEFADYFGVEGFYNDLGQLDFKNQGSIDYAAYGASVLGYWPSVHNPWSIYARLGAVGVEESSSRLLTKDEVHAKFAGGVGVRWNFADHWFTRLEFDSFATRHQGLFWSIAYHFGSQKVKTTAAQAVETSTAQMQDTQDEMQEQLKEVQSDFDDAAKEATAAAAAATTAAVAMAKGDQDGDGVTDDIDLCNKTPGGISVNEQGCAEFEGNLDGVQFESGSSKLKTSSYEQLNKVAETLAQYPNVKLTVQAHSDSVGDAQKNLILSQKRADSVVSYLESKGIESDRLAAMGYGESQPIATNDTAEGRAKNRRVQFKVEQR